MAADPPRRVDRRRLKTGRVAATDRARRIRVILFVLAEGSAKTKLSPPHHARFSTKDANLKIGVIGCGYVFDHYMATWSQHPGLVLKGVADRDMARCDAVARAYNLKAYANNEELL